MLTRSVDPLDTRFNRLGMFLCLFGTGMTLALGLAYGASGALKLALAFYGLSLALAATTPVFVTLERTLVVSITLVNLLSGIALYAAVIPIGPIDFRLKAPWVFTLGIIVVARLAFVGSAPRAAETPAAMVADRVL